MRTTEDSSAPPRPAEHPRTPVLPEGALHVLNVLQVLHVLALLPSGDAMRGRRGPLGRPPRPKTTSLTTSRGPSSAASARVDAYDDIAGDGTARTTLRRSHRAVAQTPTITGPREPGPL